MNDIWSIRIHVEEGGCHYICCEESVARESVATWVDFKKDQSTETMLVVNGHLDTAGREPSVLALPLEEIRSMHIANSYPSTV